MSFGARIVIAVVALVSAFMCFLAVLDTSGLPAGPIVFYGLSAICGIVAIACLFPKSHSVTLRLIGIVIFGTYIFYAFDSFQTRNFVRAIIGFLVWGLSSGYLAIAGRYPSWGTAEKGFKSNPRNKT